MDRDHFTDILTYILEELVGTGTDHIEIRMLNDDRNVVVTVTATLPSSRNWAEPPDLAVPAGTLGTGRGKTCDP